MKRLTSLLLALPLVLHSAAAAPAAAPEPPKPFELLDGDRVVFLGDTLMERERGLGYVETYMTVQYPDRKIAFRNLGWGADLPNGKSRASFDWNKSPDVWFGKLTNQVAIANPTVVFVGYGMAASFDGPSGVAGFKRDYERLLDAIKANAGHEVRFVLLTPVAHQNLGGAFPSGDEHNKSLKLYADAIKDIGKSRDLRVVDLFNPSTETVPPDRGFAETVNGIHLSPAGYLLMASKIAADLGWPGNAAWFSIMPDGTLRSGSAGASVTNIERTAISSQFTVERDRLPPAIVTFTNSVGAVVVVGPERTRVQFPQLDDIESYSLSVDGKVVQSGTAKDWAQSLSVCRGPAFEQAEKLRQLIVEKNTLYINRWHPENATYLFGFRKHEQGKYASEVPEFDEAVARLDEQINQLKKPSAHRYALVQNQPGVKYVQREYPDRMIGISDVPTKTRKQKYDDVKVPFEVADGFEVQLYADSDLIKKPIQMAWDTSGKLYVATSQSYPLLSPEKSMRDSVMVLSDIDGDHVADISQVFADHLQIPTGVLPGNGGVYVAQGTELLFFKDTNRDGVADSRTPVLSAFGTEDTHHLLHALHWGNDGRIYMDQSIYIHSHIETPTGVRRLNSGGIWAYRPGTDELEIYLRGFCNPWGHIFDEYGQSFVTDGAGFEGISWGVPGAMYFTYADAPRILESVSPGAYPKFAGLEAIYTPNFPEDWQGDLITCDFRAHRVVRFKLEEDGAGYVTREMPDLIRSTDVTFRPIDVKIGPDGALYIADWSNPIIQHGEVDFRDKRRDKTSGRIWRVTHKGGPVDISLNYQFMPTWQLLEKVNSPNAEIRKIVLRVLSERPEEMAKALPKWLPSQKTEIERLRALWIYQSIDRINPPLLKELLGAKDFRVRAAATRVLSQWGPWLKGSVDLLAERSRDENARVRVEALRGLARQPSAETASLILATTDRPMDRFVEYAAWLSINDVSDAWIAAIEDGQWMPDGREKQLAYGLKSIPPEKAARVLAKLLPAKLSSTGDGPWIEIIGVAGSQADLQQLYDQAVTGDFQSGALARALNALNDAARHRNLKPAGDLSRIEHFLNSDSTEVRSAALRLAGAWKEIGNAFAVVAQRAGDAKTSESERQIAFETLREIGGGKSVQALLPLCAENQPSAVRLGAVSALAGLDMARAAAIAMNVLNQFTDETAALNFWRSLLANRGAGKVLAGAAARNKLSSIAAAAGLRAVREGGRTEPDLLEALTLASSTAGPVGELTDAQIKALADKAVAQGNPDRGELVYRRTELGCTSCHSIGGVGGKVGPDLTSIGASSPADYLVESIVYPNRKVKEGYHSVVIETKDEQEFSGIMVRQSDSQIFIRNAANQEVAVAKNNIARQSTGASLMPAGLIDQLPEQDRLNLVRFLSELGKPGRFDAAHGDVARLWQLRRGTHRDEQFESSGSVAGLLEEKDWSAAPTLVDGELPQSAMKQALRTDNLNNANSMVALWAHAKFRSSKSGPVNLSLQGVDGAQVWINGKPVKAADKVSVDLPAGTYDLLVKLHPKELPDKFKVSSGDVTFLVE